MALVQIGEADGAPVHEVELGRAGIRVKVMSFGAVLRSLKVPLDGGWRELTLGFQNFADYPRASPYFGAVCGRVANRIANGRFELNGEAHQLDLNEEGRHHLHGGTSGFAWKNWTMLADEAGQGVELALTSPAGEGGYPGTVRASCRYRLEAVDTLSIDLTATTDTPCPINLAHHAYWNLDGRGTVAQHHLRLAAEAYLPTDADQIPTGEIAPVENTPYDFRQWRRIGDSDPRLDHCFVTTGTGLREVAELTSSDGRVRLVVESDQPGLQVYNGFKLDRIVAANARFSTLQGLCLEPEGLPDAPNQPAFPSVILRPGETYRQTLRLRFALDDPKAVADG